MPQTNEININIIKQIACALGDLNNRVVYVGGAVVSLYTILLPMMFGLHKILTFHWK